MSAVLALLVCALTLGTASSARADTATPAPPAGPASTGPAPSTSVDPVTFGVEPATATRPDGRSAFLLGATPGAVAFDHVALVNYSTVPLPLRLVATDAVNTDQGGITGLLASEHPTDVGAWIRIPGSAKLVTVPPRNGDGPGRVILPLQVTVPSTATPGDHSGVILAVLSTTSSTSNGANVKLDQRVGTRVFVRVTGDLRPQLSVRDLAATFHRSWNPLQAGRTTVTFTVANTGNVKLGGSIDVDVEGLLGQRSSVAAPVRLPLVLPGNSVPVTVDVSGTYPELHETATVTVTPIMARGDADPSITGVVESVDFWAIPWPLLVVALLLVAGVGAGLRRRAGRRRADDATEPGSDGLGTSRDRGPQPVGPRSRSGS